MGDAHSCRPRSAQHTASVCKDELTEEWPRTPLRRQWDFPSKYEDFSSDFTRSPWKFTPTLPPKSEWVLQDHAQGSTRTPIPRSRPSHTASRGRGSETPTPFPHCNNPCCLRVSRSSSDIPPGQVWGEKKEKALSELGFMWLRKSPSPTATGWRGEFSSRPRGPAAPPVSPGGTRTAPDGQRAKVWERSRSVLTSKEDKNGSRPVRGPLAAAQGRCCPLGRVKLWPRLKV